MGRITEEPLDPARLLADSPDPSCGAYVLFGGTVRDHHQGEGVAGMRYTAYGPMAERVLAELEAETCQRFGVPVCRIVHRVGALELEEASVLVLVRAPHRAEAFQAGQYAIDTLKERLPVWKEDFYTDGRRRHQDGVSLATAAETRTDGGERRE